MAAYVSRLFHHIELRLLPALVAFVKTEKSDCCCRVRENPKAGAVDFNYFFKGMSLSLLQIEVIVKALSP